MHKLAAALLLTAMPFAAAAADPETANRLADAEFNHGQVVETAAYLADRIGGRLTNSPAMREAERWTQQQFRDWGLRNVHAEPFDFGRGWWIESASIRMTAPRPLALRAIPVAWTPGTNGPVSAPVVVAPMSEVRHFDAWRGKLRGKIVLVTLPADPKDNMTPNFARLGDAEIAKLNDYPQANNDPHGLERRAKRRAFPAQLDAFLKAEGAVAWARMSYRPNGLLHGEGYLYKVGETPALPGIEIAAEDYRRLARLARTGPVTLEIDANVHFADTDRNAYNIFAEIPGTDNGAGSAVVMEAARLIASLGIRPRRTIRFALWAGEEQGLLGSFAWIDRNLATRPPATNPDVAAAGPYSNLYSYPVTPRPGFRDLNAYFNIDNGSGKIRGVYAEGNLAAVPVLKDWLSPFASMGAGAVVAQTTGGTDHVGMARLGVPAFQFIQDPLEYESIVHHSNLDTFDHLRAQDLRQASVILASLLLSAANADKPLPHAVLPTQPNETDPFKYDNPDER
ncbi:MAG: M28 family peptidase [Alphaproteobacteria bacterium]|nr:M28 family peptidase [Alphaproteobacteria bacterium]